MVDRAPDAVRYRAFLSYSHEDAAAAGKLHRRLETYRMPKRLVGAETPRGPVPERLAPIFRDRDEFPAATDLNEEVRAALAESGALIILCSPAAAASSWVAEEIRTFRALHPDRPILAAIVDGEPIDCFPESLRTSGPGGARIEPLATDLRPQGDGKTLGLLKLVAGITGVPLDALVQRDAARRVRRVMAVSVAAVIAMLMMAGLTLFAFDARREAERQRVEAELQRNRGEGLIEFMLTDLREKLRGVGKVQIMIDVNRRALQHYGGQIPLEGLSQEALEHRARILHVIGEDEKTEGRLDTALRAFREAHRITGEQLDRMPADPERIFAHAQSKYWLASIKEMHGDYALALLAYQEYREEAERINRIRPNQPRYIGELAYSESNLGIIKLRADKRYAEARRHFEISRRWFDRASNLEPNNARWRYEAADARGWIADTWYFENRYREAREVRLQQLRILQQMLSDDRDNRLYFYMTVVVLRTLGRIDMQLHDYARALPFLDEARGAIMRLLAIDPDNLTWRDQATRIEANRAELFMNTGRRLAAAEALQSARALLAGTQRRSDTSTADRTMLGDQLGQLEERYREQSSR